MNYLATSVLLFVKRQYVWIKTQREREFAQSNIKDNSTVSVLNSMMLNALLLSDLLFDLIFIETPWYSRNFIKYPDIIKPAFKRNTIFSHVC